MKLCSLVTMITLLTVNIFSANAYAFLNYGTFTSSITGDRWYVRLESEQIGTNKYSIESYSWQTSGYKFDTVYADIELYCSGINNPFNDNYGDQLNHITVSTSNASGGYCAGLGASSVGVNDYDYGYGGTTVTLTYSPN